ncbi:MAG TPA: metallophosphoesterase family protein [Candidatus Sulfotelmatobacter sp.]|nr:metallophosphoesterase family protein [Candidatus Sulfotelmatobacter sp.]
MATIAVGDVHGHASALEDLLERVLPDLGPGDRLVFLGDLIDRGPDSKQVLDRVARLRRESRHEVICLMGNHEQWLLDSLRDPTQHHWALSCSAFSTIASYAPDAAAVLRRLFGEIGPRLFEEKIAMPYDLFFDQVPAEHIVLLQSMRYFDRSDDVICVHGGVRPDGTPPSDADGGLLIWGHPDFPDDYRGSERVVYGHHDDAILDATGWPAPRVLRNRTYGIDSISRGVLTALRFPDLKLYRGGVPSSSAVR